MCGIVAVLARPSTCPEPELGAVLEQLARAGAAVALARSQLPAGPGSVADPEIHTAAERLVTAAEDVEAADARLRGVPGLAALLHHPDLAAALREQASGLGVHLRALEADFDSGRVGLPPERLESLNAVLVRLRDAQWAIESDRLGAATRVGELAPPGVEAASASPAALGVLWAIDVALGSIDRLEVRGRDSAGLHVALLGHRVDPVAEERLLAARLGDALFASMAARTPAGSLSLVYKAAAEIGELGDNVAALRAAVSADALLGLALQSPEVTATVIGHTRWASVGVISEANAHPLNSEELDAAAPYVVAALNGDVDNHAELRASENLRFPDEITTDAKVIPALVSRAARRGLAAEEAFRRTVARLEGSVAVVAGVAEQHDRLYLALRGSGQSLYVGLAADAYVVASEPYGLVQETSRYVRMDGEVTQGQVVVLERSGAGTLAGMTRRRYDGGEAPVGSEDVTVAPITTRDVDRGGFPHFLLKEITEAPASFRKTLRGKVLAGPDGRLSAVLGPETLTAELSGALAEQRIRRALIIGQGTAAVAGRAVAAAIGRCLPGLDVHALPASELSGFGLADDMHDTLVVAISQSGTTTDTNRAVDLVRARGASVIAIVNRRNSDLVTKAHGTLYTSDGRDVEMSVASTKAFYAQVAAGWLLALGLAAAAGVADPAETDRLLSALRRLPDAMSVVLASRDHVAAIAARLAPPRRYWTVVGSGPDAVAAAEVRIKCSELCYRSIGVDTTEDKKHIDLSCEPLILVCAAGLSGPNADDVAKEVAIYRAHKAAPVVIAAEGETGRYAGAVDVVAVPPCEPELAFVLSAMVGHLFGYEAALAIDAQARPLRVARAVIEAASGVPDDDLLATVSAGLADAAGPFLTGLASGAYDGNLTPSVAARLVSLLRYATGVLPVEGYELESGKVAAPRVLLGDLLDALSEGIDQLTRPVDAIKHQAKTVTVGTSRSEEALLALPLVRETLAVGASADALGYRALRTLGHLDPAVEAVLGYTRYRVEWPTDPEAWPGAVVVDQGGVAQRLRSRTATDPRLRGTKHRAAVEREVTVARGEQDGRTVVIVPEVKANAVVGITLLHVRLATVLPAATAKAVLSGYRGRYAALRDAVTETEPSMDDQLLGEVPVVELLTEPVYVLARRWRRNAHR
jgi:glucosamine--fructose-6-phosphate aminotransferase (isomerizing)